MNSEDKQYRPLALKYRPSKFADLIGQEVLVQTLSSAILSKKIASAYLLTGIRGIGKTTSARIIASIVNCENPQQNGKEVEACGICNNCKAFQAGNHPDILEIDAASRTSVDDVRTIIDSSEYKAFLGKYKIFIIDEVHMISKNAFNALLKTLEEPPKGVLFIFATTEVNKIPVTILSRCQRFDLKRFTGEDVDKLLTKIADNEKFKYEKDALNLIAVKSEGSARDAISMLDQASLLAISQNGGQISLELVREMLAVTSLDLVISYVSNILNKDSEAAFGIIEKIYANSGDILFFVQNLLDVIGYLSKLSTLPNYEEKAYLAYNKEMKQIADKFDISVLTIIWQIFTKSIPDIKESHNQLLSLEMTTIKALYACKLPSPMEAIEALRNEAPRELERPRQYC